MRQVGCRSASSAVTPSSSDARRPRNGPPEAVRMSRRISDASRPCRHWWMALCSLSTGRIVTPRRRAASVTIPPAITSTSLFASAIVFPCSIAARTASSAFGAGRRAEHEVHVGRGRDGHQPVAARPRQRRRPSRRRREAGRGPSPDAIATVRRPVPRDLLGEQLGVLAGREADDRQAIGDARRRRTARCVRSSRSIRGWRCVSSVARGSRLVARGSARHA